MKFTTLLAFLFVPVLARAQPCDPANAKLAWILPWDKDWVTAVAFVSPTRLVAGNNQGEILVWQLPEKTEGIAPLPVRKLQSHTNTINRLYATPDGRWLLSASSDHRIQVWDLDAEGKNPEIVVLNERAILSAHEKKKKPPTSIEAKVATQNPTRTLEGHQEWVLGLGMNRNGTMLASGDDKGTVILWDWPTGKERRRWQIKGWVWALALAPDTSAMLISERRPLVFDSGRHTGLKIWDPADGSIKHDLAKTFKDKEIFAAAAFSPDGKLLAVGRGGEVDGPNGKITFFDPATGNKLRELTPGHLNGLTDLTFSPDGQHLFSAGRDTMVRAWNVADGKLIKELGQSRGGQFKDWIHSVAVSPDSRWLAAADMAGQVQVWSLRKE